MPVEAHDEDDSATIIDLAEVGPNEIDPAVWATQRPVDPNEPVVVVDRAAQLEDVAGIVLPDALDLCRQIVRPLYPLRFTAFEGGTVFGLDLVEKKHSLLSARGVPRLRVCLHRSVDASRPLQVHRFPTFPLTSDASQAALHHWPNPAAGLAETHCVLRPGGVARIYNVVEWIRRFEQGGASIAQLAQESPFGDRGSWTRTVTVRLGPLPLVYLAELRREEPRGPTKGER